ncbi:unnamed protein product [Lampetra planeri]
MWLSFVVKSVSLSLVLKSVSLALVLKSVSFSLALKEATSQNRRRHNGGGGGESRPSGPLLLVFDNNNNDDDAQRCKVKRASPARLRLSFATRLCSRSRWRCGNSRRILMAAINPELWSNSSRLLISFLRDSAALRSHRVNCGPLSVAAFSGARDS